MKLFFKLFMCTAFLFTHCYSKNIIWDLGDVLVGFSKIGMTRGIGIQNLFSYIFLDWKSPTQLHPKAFALLRAIKNNSEQALYTTDFLPDVYQDCMAGKITGAEIIELAKAKIEELDAIDKANTYVEKYFASDREKRIILNTIQVMFNPVLLAQNTYPLTNILKIVKECAEKTDANGKKEHTLYILSNYASDAFNELYALETKNALFQHFKFENICISGNIGLAKPDPAAFRYMLKTYSLDPADTIFIDDREDNVAAAQAFGITGIQLVKHNHAFLRNKLIELAIV